MKIISSQFIESIYLDHAAATPLDPSVFEAMQPYLKTEFGNASALYKSGQISRQAIERSRQQVATILNTVSESIIFTSGGTESDNLAIYGIARAHEEFGKHVITLGIEHPAVLEPLRDLEKNGFQVTYLPVSTEGIVEVKNVINAIRPDTILVTIMYANNEVGSVQPIAEIGREILKYRQKNKTVYPYFHSDACQAANYLDLGVERLHLDAMTLNGSKTYGPKGSGCLYVRKGVVLKPLMRGGGQEFTLRSGTENVPAIVGFGEALMVAQEMRVRENERLAMMSAYFWQEIHKSIPKAGLNGPIFGQKRLPNNVHVTFPGVEGEQLLLYLDQVGISCSAASACANRTYEDSHVLKALAIDEAHADQSIRFTLGRSTTQTELATAAKHIVALYKQLSKNS